MLFYWNLMMNSVYKLACLVLVFFISSCGTVSEKERFSSSSERDMELVAKKYLDSGSYTLASEFYATLNRTYPYAKDNQQNRVYGIYSYVMDQNYEKAISDATYFEKLHPNSKYIAWVRFLDAYAQFKLNRKWIQDVVHPDRAMNDISNLDKAYYKAGLVISYYPKTKYAKAAAELQHRINSILAKEELDVANFYFGREAYIAAARRASSLIKKFPSSCEVPPALNVLQKSYANLGLTSWANDIKSLRDINKFN